jgi:hypothetical protein
MILEAIRAEVEPGHRRAGWRMVQLVTCVLLQSCDGTPRVSRTAVLEVPSRSVRSCDVVLRAAGAPTLGFSGAVKGTYRRHDDVYALAFVSRGGPLLIPPLHMRWQQNLDSSSVSVNPSATECYDALGTRVSGSQVSIRYE